MFTKSGRYRVPPSTCLNCGTLLNGAGIAPGDDQDAPPQAGNLSVCINCGAVSIFGDDLKLRPLEPVEVENVTADKQYMDYLAGLTRTIHFVKAARN